MVLHRRWLGLAVVALTACGNGGSSHYDGGPTDAATRTIAPSEMGIATYYDATGAGNCSFDPSPDDLNVAAMDGPEYDDSAVCGECVLVTGPSGSVTVRIVDSCPDCETGHLDLSQSAFAQIADVSLGRVSITWQPVTCDVSGPLAYRFKEGSSQYWVGIQVRNSRLPISTLEAMVSGAWMSIPRESYDYFVASSGLGPGPFSLRVTASDGQQVIESGIALEVAEVVQGTQQFQ